MKLLLADEKLHGLGIHLENQAKKMPIICFVSEDFGVKETRHSENIAEGE